MGSYIDLNQIYERLDLDSSTGNLEFLVSSYRCFLASWLLVGTTIEAITRGICTLPIVTYFLGIWAQNTIMYCPIVWYS